MRNARAAVRGRDEKWLNNFPVSCSGLLACVKFPPPFSALFPPPTRTRFELLFPFRLVFLLLRSQARARAAEEILCVVQVTKLNRARGDAKLFFFVCCMGLGKALMTRWRQETFTLGA